MCRNTQQRSRRAAATVEMALLLPVCLMVLFGIIEGCRLIAARQLLDNATREAARLAAVSTATLSTADIQAVVTNCYAGGVAAPGLTVLVYQADPTTGQNIGAWTSAGQGACIGVEATDNYTLGAVPFGILPSTVTLHAKSVVYSEGN